VSHLRAEFGSRYETVIAADDVTFAVGRGQCLALVGQSGSGKTTIARTVAGLHPIASGEITLHGERLAALARHRSLEQRRRLQIIFQSPADALNPRENVGDAVARPARVLRGLSRRAAHAEVERLLELVRLPGRLSARYPRELSGGELQRVCIARALAPQPDVIICDEITSALDVSVQAAVLKLLTELRENLGLAMLFITHDLGVVALIADEVLVLNLGKICESGGVEATLRAPNEKYTRQLLAAAPSISHALQLWDAHDAKTAALTPHQH
jgi:peptide/nickel transport system ATP-binding protein